jgi:MYXO-CTERM domain-containing protein
MAGEVVWQLGNLGADEGGDRSFVIELADFGLYDNAAALDYRVGLNDFSLPSNVVQTLYGDEPPGDGDGDGDPGDGDGDPGDGDGDSGGATGEDGNEQGESASDSGDTGEAGTDGGALDAGDRGCACTTTERGSMPLGWLLLGGLGLGLVRRRGGAA